MNNKEIDFVGQVISGDVAGILIREKNVGKNIELGDLLIIDEDDNNSVLLKVFDLSFGSQISPSNMELAAGLSLEGMGDEIGFYESNLRNYTLANAKAIIKITKEGIKIPKVLPKFFSKIRYATKEDLQFISKPPEDPVYLGNIRSGSKVLDDVPVYLNGTDFFTHHVLIPATTGRGKSNLVKTMLWSVLKLGKFGVLVLDAHDEYYGRHELGLKDHQNAKEKLRYYSSDAPVGSNTLLINIRTIAPEHFEGIVNFTEAQKQAIWLFSNTFRETWIERIVLSDVGEFEGLVQDTTLAVLQRKLRTSLGIYQKDGEIICDNPVFSLQGGESTLDGITGHLQDGKIVIIDTSKLADQTELLIGSMIASKVFYRYRASKGKGQLIDNCPISIIIEEAPRVLSNDQLQEAGENIYSTIAREGRKFKVGLIAITQLTSLIPKIILSNLNTKIILGNEMSAERRAIIDCAAQDLSEEDRTIGSLDKGEAIVSSVFTKFAIPIYTPLFEDIARRESKKDNKDDYELKLD